MTNITWSGNIHQPALISFLSLEMLFFSKRVFSLWHIWQMLRSRFVSNCFQQLLGNWDADGMKWRKATNFMTAMVIGVSNCLKYYCVSSLTFIELYVEKQWHHFRKVFDRNGFFFPTHIQDFQLLSSLNKRKGVFVSIGILCIISLM